MSTSIFISYRRSDGADVVGRIYDKLVTHFPPANLFRDLDSIPLGKAFPQVIREQLAKSAIVLVMIGPQWLTLLRQRQSDPIDFVREEVRMALELSDNVIPLTILGGKLPTQDELADFPDLLPLLDRNGIAIRSDPDFHPDMDRLLRSLRAPLESSSEGLTGSGPTLRPEPLKRKPTRYSEDTLFLTDSKSSTFRIVVAGRRKQGKTTLVNRLLENGPLPNEVARSVLIPVRARWGEEPAAYAIPASDARWQVTSTWPEALQRHLTPGTISAESWDIPLDEISELLISLADHEESLVERLELFWPAPLLNPDVELWDTPGIDSSAPEESWLEAISTADLVLYVVQDHHLTTQDRISVSRKLKRPGSNPFRIVVTQSPEGFRTNSDSQQVKNVVASMLKVSSEWVYCLDQKKELLRLNNFLANAPTRAV